MSFLLLVNPLPDTTLRLLYSFVKMWYKWTPVVKPSMTFPERSSSSRVCSCSCVCAHSVCRSQMSMLCDFFYHSSPYPLRLSPSGNLELFSPSRPTDQPATDISLSLGNSGRHLPKPSFHMSTPTQILSCVKQSLYHLCQPPSPNPHLFIW